MGDLGMLPGQLEDVISQNVLGFLGFSLVYQQEVILRGCLNYINWPLKL